MSIERKSWSPLWLEYSGLPELLNSKTRGAGWPVFKKVVELDCDRNASPEVVEISFEELGRLIGLSAATVRKSVQGLRKLEVLASFIPETDEEPALMKIRIPLATPMSIDEIKERHPALFADETHYFRYAATDVSEPETPDDPLLQEIVDLYFNAVGLKMNAFILDELRLIRSRYPADVVRRTFRRAQQNEIRSLHWVVRELVRLKKKDEEKGQDRE